MKHSFAFASPLLPPTRLLIAVLSCTTLVMCGPPAWPGGIHAQLAWSPQGVRVVEVPSGSVAERAGLRAGDRLVAIDGKPSAGETSEHIRGQLTGEVGSLVKLQVMRGEELVELTVERAPYRPAARP